jgi:thiol-disulfide isomerase/thioredoxin
LRGKVVLIDFWASWCGPCHKENPNVVKMYNRFKNEGFEIYGVSLDRDRAAWLKAIETDGLQWLHVSDLKFWQSEAAQAYSVQAIPATYLIGKDGNILAKNLRGKALESKVEEVLKVQ